MVKCASFNKEVPQVSYPLGLMYLAAYARERLEGLEHVILDLTCEPRPLASLAESLARFQPHVVAASALTNEAACLHQVAHAAKEHNPNTVVVAGGPHVSACPHDVAEDKAIDLLVFGEGEATYEEILARLQEGQGLTGMPGAAWREGESVVRGPERPPLEDLDALPFPAWDLVRIERYARKGRAGNLPRGRYMSLFTSRGCPFGCTYCHRVFPKRFRARSASRVLEEIDTLERTYGIRDFEILDDAFNLDLERAKAVCRGLVGRGFTFSFPNGVRADRLDRELVSLLAAMGTTNLAIAVDTASAQLQRALGRNLDLARVRQAISWCREEGITTVGYFMLGFPGETKAQMEETISFAVDSDLTFASFFIVTPYPGTPLWNHVVGSKAVEVDHRAMNVFSGYFNLSALTTKQLRAIQRSAYIRFYRRRLGRLVAALPKLRVDWRNAAWIAWRRMVDRGAHLRTLASGGRVETGQAG